MKGISRTDLPGKNHGLTRDDALFWTDWTVAAALALVTTMVVSASRGNAVFVNLVYTSIVTMLVSFTFFPFFLRILAYDSGAKLKTWGWRGIGWILIANGMGILVLFGAVLAGASIYDSR
jgi:hypothetical protein